MDQVRTVVVLQSDRFPFDGPGPDPNNPPGGRDVALLLMDEMSKCGHPPLFANPYEGEGGWSWDVEVDGTEFDLFIHWAPIGNPPEDRWVIQPGRRFGIVRTLFGRRATPRELAPICDLLHQLVDRHPAFSAVEWLTQEEFRTVY